MRQNTLKEMRPEGLLRSTTIAPVGCDEAYPSGTTCRTRRVRFSPSLKRMFMATSLTLAALTASAQTSLPVYQDESKPLEERVQDALNRMTLEEKCRLSYAQSKFSSPGVPRLGIPELYMSDGPHGVRPEIKWNAWDWAGWTNDGCTAFPALTCLAATWNPELALLYGKNVGEEARYREKDVLLGPGVNIYRTPLNGRNFEYMGEDPLLSGIMAGEWIRGLQTNGVACCIKHYVLNDQEEFRGHVDVKVSDRALYEIYLRPFQIAIERGDAWSLMSSYNKYRGIHCGHNPYTLNDILKGEWGFKGAVISDWGAAHDTKQAALYGLDLEMGSYTNGLSTEATGFDYDDYYLGKNYLEMAKKGEIPMEVVNDKAGRMLRLLFRTAMNTKKPFGSIRTAEHAAANRLIAEEGIVLLKNEAIKVKGESSAARLLPIEASKYKTVLVVGENATKPLTPGGGSSELKAEDEVSALRGIRERFSKEWTILHAQGYESGASRFDGADFIPEEKQKALYDEAIEKAKKADLIIYIGGLNKNHYEDCEGGDRRFYNMSYNQDKLIADLIAIQPKTIVVITSGNAVAMPWLKQTPALVQNWYLGSETGHALAAVLSGDVCPSGKTVFTYAEKLEDYPAHRFGLVGYPGVQPKDMPKLFQYGDENPKSADLLANFTKNQKAIPSALSTAHLNTDFDARTHNGKGNEQQVYAEDILTGYRYFETQKQPVVFPFGYGLSYTTFQYSKPTISTRRITKDSSVTVTIDVTNTGSRTGKEVVQLYVGDDKASVVRPAKELRGFQKVELQPGETRTVSFVITVDDLKFFDEDKHEWVAEPGGFKAFIGASVADIKATLPFVL